MKQVEDDFEKWWGNFEGAPGGLGLEFIPEEYRSRVWVGLKHTARSAFVGGYDEGYHDGERQLMQICLDKFPAAIKTMGSGFFLDAHKLMVGKFRITYWNSETNEKAFDVINDFEACLSLTHEFLAKTKHEVISRAEWEREFNPPSGLCDKLET